MVGDPWDEESDRIVGNYGGSATEHHKALCINSAMFHLADIGCLDVQMCLCTLCCSGVVDNRWADCHRSVCCCLLCLERQGLASVG
mmetsp:Transcript_22637/g.38317  ORF Transcript_22637/g.38317 Transcript_22637/m.38317 type:complete len:86 (-) Transcript_22637:136-393(-)